MKMKYRQNIAADGATLGCELVKSGSTNCVQGSGFVDTHVNTSIKKVIIMGIQPPSPEGDPPTIRN
jgi:hypothetical protein